MKCFRKENMKKLRIDQVTRDLVAQIQAKGIVGETINIKGSGRPCVK